MNNEQRISKTGEIWDERRLRVATEAAGVALWSWNVDTDRFTMDEHAFQLWGLPQKNTVTFEELSNRIHPEDLDKVRASFDATRELTGAYEIDFRILHGDDVRWISARGRGDDEGILFRIMYGVFLDVTFRKLAEEEREVVVMEMHHRIKNLFNLSSALASISSRNSDTKEAMLKDLKQRLNGLAKAHDLILPGFHDQQQAVKMKDLLTVLLQAYSLDTNSKNNVCISSSEFLVGERSITSIAMLIHELATNSVKYGALSADTGRLVLDCLENESYISIVWNETGVDTGKAPPESNGFGSEMTERVIKQVNGSIARSWTDDGLTVTLRMSKALLGA